MTNLILNRRGSAQIVIPLVLLLLLGGAAVTYTLYSNKSSDQLVQDSMVNFSKVKSFSFKTTLDSEGTQSTPAGTIGGIIRVDGSVDLTSEGDPKTLLNIELIPPAGHENSSISGKGELRFVDKNLYIKIDSVKMPLSFATMFVTALEGRWIKIDQKDLKQSGRVDVNVNELTDRQKEIVAVFRNFISSRKIFKVGSDMGVEEDNGLKLHHYKDVIQKEAIAGGLPDLVSALAKADPDNFGKKQPSAEELAKSEKAIMDWNAPDIDVWLIEGKEEIHKVSFSIPDSSSKNAPPKAQITLMLGDFNKPMPVDVPAGAKPLDELISQMFSGFGGLSVPKPMQAPLPMPKIEIPSPPPVPSFGQMPQ